MALLIEKNKRKRMNKKMDSSLEDIIDAIIGDKALEEYEQDHDSISSGEYVKNLEE